MKRIWYLSILALLGSFSFYGHTIAQSQGQYVRMVTLVIDSTQLESFKAALKEDIETAVRTEPGVLTLYAVYEKENPTHVTLFEMYANQEAHQAHQQTAHFLKYKQVTKGMVKSTLRTEVVPIALEAKPK